MIHVEITLWPYGDVTRARHLGSIDIANDGMGSQTVGNYRAVLSQRGRPERVWKTARIMGFPRKRLGAYDLLYRVLREVVGERNE